MKSFYENQYDLESYLVRYRIALVAAVFVLGVVLAVAAAYLLRFDFDTAAAWSREPWIVLIPALFIKAAVFWRVGLFQGWWRYASIADAMEILKATIVAGLLLTLFLVLAYRFENVPRSIPILDAVFTFFFFTGTRFVVRLFRESYLPSFSGNSDLVNVLVLGAAEAGQAVARELRKSPELQLRLVGFLDDDPLKRNARFQGVPVLGRIDELAEIAKSFNFDQIIVAIPGANSREMRRILDVCKPLGKKVKTLPAMSDLIDGRVSIKQIRDVDVRDLLGRRAIELNVAGISDFLQGKTVLVTGAAGSIGSELCLQIVAYEPAQLVLFDLSESGLFFLERELGSLSECKIVPIVGDVRLEELVRTTFQKYSPDVVFHAAAYKHVPLMEAQPHAAISANVLGSKIVADIADESGCEAFVMVSTDKAVNPTNVMGATKRCAEMYVQKLSARSKTRLVTVRFGNVLDSAGSVIPIFRQQILEGGPVTVTHPDVTRFFMTIPEASQLVIQAGCMGKGGEIFLLDMGEPVKITYLAEELIRLSGFEPKKDIEIVFTGLRPGEKLYEELLLEGEGIRETAHKSIRIAGADNVRVANFDAKLNELLVASAAADRADFVKRLSELVPEYEPKDFDNDDVVYSSSA